MLKKSVILIRSRKGLFVLAAIFCALVIGAILVGIEDNERFVTVRLPLAARRQIAVGK